MELTKQFAEVVELIKASKVSAIKAANTSLIDLYWQLGEYLSSRVQKEKWGKSVIKKLAEHIMRTEPELKGYSDKNLWRIKQFYETYRDLPKLSPLVREISWTNNLIIITAAKSVEEKEFYLKLCAQENYGKRELERQIASSVFERVMIGNQKIPPMAREIKKDLTNSFKDSYVLDFLNIPEEHNEKQLQKALVGEMKKFILELGKDFLFMGEEYHIQAGNSDFYIDLLFYHRGLQCLVAFELKTGKFKPEFIGKINFYLEALDRDVKKANENPSIGVLLCKYKDDEVVEYALSRSLSPSLVAAYQIQLPDKKLLQQKMHEIFERGK